MMGYTHLAGGAYCGALAGSLTGDAVVGMTVGAIAGLLPDIDHPGSILGRRVQPVSVAIAIGAGHRGLTHTVWFCMAAAVAAMAGVSMLGEVGIGVDKVGLFVLAGALSHLALDALTASGVRPFALPGPVAGLASAFGRSIAGFAPARLLRLFASVQWCLAKLAHIKGPVQTGSVLIEGPITLVLVVLTLQTTKII